MSKPDQWNAMKNIERHGIVQRNTHLHKNLRNVYPKQGHNNLSQFGSLHCGSKWEYRSNKVDTSETPDFSVYL